MLGRVKTVPVSCYPHMLETLVSLDQRYGTAPAGAGDGTGGSSAHRLLPAMSVCPSLQVHSDELLTPSLRRCW